MVIKTTRRHTAEVTNAWEGSLDEALEKLVHALSTQRHLRANRLIFS